jgi:hypothetical protein
LISITVGIGLSFSIIRVFAGNYKRSLRWVGRVNPRRPGLGQPRQHPPFGSILVDRDSSTTPWQVGKEDFLLGVLTLKGWEYDLEI